VNIVDLSGKYPYLAKGPLGTVRGLVVHHTASSDTATPAAIAAGWKKTGTSSQFIMGRDGTVYQMVPDGQKAYQIKPSWNPAIPWASNSSTIGIELIAKDDKDITPAQVASLQQFALQQASKYGFDPATNVVGHGEINGQGAPAGTNPNFLRQPTEGMTAVTALRTYLADNPTIEAAYVPNSAVDAINNAVPADQTAALAYAPTPMPGRPAALDAEPGSVPAAEPPAKLVKLPSGQMIPVGSYPSNDGKHNVIVADDGHGNAVVSKQLNPGEVPGLIDPLHEGEGTVAGKAVQTIVQGKAADAVKVAAPEIGQVLATASTAIGEKTSALGGNILGTILNAPKALSGLGNTFHGLFGGNATSMQKLVAIGQAVTAQARGATIAGFGNVAASAPSESMDARFGIVPANQNKAGGIDYTPSLDSAGNYVPNPNRLRVDGYAADVTSTEHPAYQVSASGLGALSDARTSTLITPQTVEYGGTRNGRDVMLVDGQPEYARAPIVTFNDTAEISPALYSPKPMGAVKVNFSLPTTMAAALSGTPMADLGSAMDQHLSSEAAKVGSGVSVPEPKPTIAKAAPVSTAILKPHTPAAPVAPTPAPKPIVSRATTPAQIAADTIGAGPGTFADFSKSIQPVPAKPVAPTAVQPPTVAPATRTITETVANPAYAQWEQAQAKVNQDVQAAHDRRELGDTTPIPSQPQQQAPTPQPPPKTITQTRTVPVQAPAPAQAGGGGYTIQKGDTLSQIAARNGTTVGALVRANGISNPNLIYAGQSLTIPKSNQPTISQPTTKTSGAPQPANNNSGSSGQIFVDKATGRQLTPTVIDDYNADTNTWGKKTVYL
jgi:LysM repeat protein